MPYKDPARRRAYKKAWDAAHRVSKGSRIRGSRVSSDVGNRTPKPEPLPSIPTPSSVPPLPVPTLTVAVPNVPEPSPSPTEVPSPVDFPIEKIEGPGRGAEVLADGNVAVDLVGPTEEESTKVSAFHVRNPLLASRRNDLDLGVCPVCRTEDRLTVGRLQDHFVSKHGYRWTLGMLGPKRLEPPASFAVEVETRDRQDRAAQVERERKQAEKIERETWTRTEWEAIPEHEAIRRKLHEQGWTKTNRADLFNDGFRPVTKQQVIAEEGWEEVKG